MWWAYICTGRLLVFLREHFLNGPVCDLLFAIFEEGGRYGCGLMKSSAWVKLKSEVGVPRLLTASGRK